MKRLSVLAMSLAMATLILAVGCAAPAAPTPTAAPPKPAATTAPAAPAATAPAKAAEPTKPAAAATAAPTKPAAAATAAPTKPAAAAKPSGWPQSGRNMTLLVPYAAGGATDIQARLLAVPLEKELGFPVQIVNKAGAATQLGATDLVTNTKPDGYTLYANELPSTAMTYLDPSRKAIYTRKDFQTVAGHVLDPAGMCVKADSPIKNLKDLVDAMKANPTQVKVGTVGAGTASHLGADAIGKQAGAKFDFVHFNGNAPAITALLGGRRDRSDDEFRGSHAPGQEQ